jgi:hypothetical protein
MFALRAGKENVHVTEDSSCKITRPSQTFQNMTIYSKFVNLLMLKYTSQLHLLWKLGTYITRFLDFYVPFSDSDISVCSESLSS